MGKLRWAVGAGIWCVSVGVAACGGDAHSGAAADSGAPASVDDGGRNDGGRAADSGGDETASQTDAGAAGYAAGAAGGRGGDELGDNAAGAAGVAGVELELLPYAGLGPCLFVPTTGSPTGNSNCSNGIFEGDITIATASDLERLSGCRRITGNLKVLSPTLKSLEGLEALQQVD